MDSLDPFETLGLPRNASAKAIKARYHALARKYHPNRTIVRVGDGDKSTSLDPDYFHRIHQAWQILRQADNRRRRSELLDLLELQDEMLAHYEDLLKEIEEQEEIHQSKQHGTNMDGNISSDADEDLPNVGIDRRKTVLKRESRVSRQAGDRRESLDLPSPTNLAPPSKWDLIKSASVKSGTKADGQHPTDYFSKRRKKLEKLRRKELDAFLGYRNAVLAKFESEEAAERHKELYEHAKWKREYFQRAPRATTERMRSFQHMMGAVAAFTHHTPGLRNRTSTSSSIGSPVAGHKGRTQLRVPEPRRSRKKSTHRRGWSDDITGDQTESSDEDSGDAHEYGGMPPTRYWHHHTRPGREYMYGSIHRASNEFKNDAKPTHPFKLIVKHPTQPSLERAQRDSSGESVFDSSRSLSPDPRDPENMQLTVVPTSGAAELFRAAYEQRVRSPSPASRYRHFSVTGADGSGAAHEGCQCILKQVHSPEQQCIPFSHVRLLSRDAKSRLLGAEPDTDTLPAALLQSLRQLNERVASKFEVKRDIVQLFNFRLLYGNKETTDDQHQSYIALSYRRRLHVERQDDHYTLPLEPDLFQAVWDERQSNIEGVWVDQICIDQESDAEKTISMSAMDTVYRCARLIVVVLDDIEFSASEGEVLQSHMNDLNSPSHVSWRQRFRHKQPPYLDSHEDLYRAVRKMLSSSWFRRAWCRHEMRLAKQHIFLIPCQSLGPSGRDVLKFDSKTISHLLDLSIEVPFEASVESVMPALQAFFHDRNKPAMDERQVRIPHGNFSTVAAEVFAMEAGGDPRIAPEKRLSDARKDKIAIVLNTMECGLALESRYRLDGCYERDNECFHDLSLLALAAGDPGVLCSVGTPLPITDIVSSWLYAPTVADAGLNNTKTLQHLPHDAQFVVRTEGTEHSIELELKFLRSRREHWRPTTEENRDLLELARHFMGQCDKNKWGRNRERYLTHDRKANLLFGSMWELYAETLACIFHCGPEWMSDVCQRYGMARWKVSLPEAYELVIALKSTSGRWPNSAWKERAASFIMDFVNFVAIRGLPVRQLSQPERWRPCCVTLPSGGKVLSFLPLVDRNVQVAVPQVLINPNYVHLARLWLLRPRRTADDEDSCGGGGGGGDGVDEWTLLGRSVVFSDELAVGQMTTMDGEFKRRKIYGRNRAKARNGGGRRRGVPD